MSSPVIVEYSPLPAFSRIEENQAFAPLRRHDATQAGRTKDTGR
jgi:hypothetical protein